jgi:hypothetical protein
MVIPWILRRISTDVGVVLSNFDGDWHPDLFEKVRDLGNDKLKEGRSAALLTLRNQAMIACH